MGTFIKSFEMINSMVTEGGFGRPLQSKIRFQFEHFSQTMRQIDIYRIFISYSDNADNKKNCDRREQLFR